MLENPNKYKKVLKQLLYKKVNRSLKRPIYKKGFIVRYRDKKGRFTKFRKGKKVIVEYYYKKYIPLRIKKEKSTAEKKVTKGSAVSKILAEWAVLSTFIGGRSGRIREMADYWAANKGISLPIHIREKAPIPYKYINTELLFVNDEMKIKTGRYITFFILIAVMAEKHIDMLTIRKTVLLQKPVTPHTIDTNIFDDLGKDYVRRSASFWAMPEFSPQVSRVEYVGWICYHISAFVPKRAYK